MPALVQAWGKYDSVGAFTESAASSSAVTAGNAVLVAVSWATSNNSTGDTLSISDNQGNTYSTAITPINTNALGGGGNFQVGMFYALNIKSSGILTVTATFSNNNGFVRFHCHEVSGISAFDQAVSTTGASGNTTTATITPAVANEFLLVYGLNNSGTSGATGSGWSAGVTEGAEATEYKVAATTAAIAGTYTNDGSNYIAQIMAFKPAVSGTAYTSTLTDALTWSELVLRSTVHLVTTSWTWSEGVTRSSSKRLAVESAIPSDAISKLPGKVESEAITPADTLTRSPLKSVQETYTVGELWGRLFSGLRTVSDAVSSSDTLLRLPQKAFSEGMSLSELFARGMASLRTFSETVSLNESLARLTGKLAAETVSCSDSLGRLYTGFRSWSESLAVTDTLARAPGKLWSETVAVGDTLTRLYIGFRNWTESLAVTDSLARMPGKAWSELLAWSETLVRSTRRVLGDVLTWSELIGFGAAGHLLLFLETFSPTETVSRLVAQTRSETVSPQDALLRTPGKLWSESLPASETLTRQPAKLTIDGMAVSEQLERSTSKSFADTVTWSDVFALLRGAFLTLADLVPCTEQLGRATLKSCSAVLIVSDALVRSTARSWTDSVLFIEQLSKTTGKKVADVLSLSDTLARSTVRRLAELYAIADSWLRNTGRGLVLAETIVLADVLSSSLGRLLALADTLLPLDGLSRGVARTLRDTLTWTEAVFSYYFPFIVRNALTLLLVERLPLGDSLLRQLWRPVAKVVIPTTQSNVQRYVQPPHQPANRPPILPPSPAGKTYSGSNRLTRLKNWLLG